MNSEKPDVWMPLLIGKYIADTTHLSRDQHGGYLLLLMAMWMKGGELPDHDDSLANIAKATRHEWRTKLRPILAPFFRVSGGFWRQKRLSIEFAAAIAKQEKDRVRASNAANVRWRKDAQSNAPSTPQAMPEECPIPIPLTSKASSKTKRFAASPLPDWVPAEAWRRWQKHRGRKLTPEAVALQIPKLDALRQQGHEPTAMIDLAIESCWATFWPPREGSGRGNGREPTLAERRAANMDETTGRTRNGRIIDADAGAMDRAPVRAALRDLRKPDDDDVG